jgi:phage/plasmid-associated DNA primase
MSTNHRPDIPDGSEAIWDRIKLIPFNQRFDGKKADTELPEKLREELPGVLTWAVRGCVEWAQNGLGTAAAVEAATAEYREETDVVDRFFRDVCEFGPDKWVWTKDLFTAWEAWCMDEGEDPGKQTGFSKDMKERGKVKNFVSRKGRKGNFWEGIAVIQEGGVVSSPNQLTSEKSSENDGSSADSANAPHQESPAKHGGVVDSVERSPEIAKGFSGTPSRREPLKNSDKRSNAPQDDDSDPFEHFNFGGME